jgi:CDP-diacylglycerol--glycerol-3-phosphate 3-phosphatidyltransferase
MTPPYTQVLFNWPNLITLLRISFIPVLVVFFYLPVWWGHLAAAIIFAVASMTDWLDGYLARYLKQTTKLGTFLDPVADKLMVSVVLVLIVAEPTFQLVSTSNSIVSIPTAVIAIPAAVIVARELIVSALREWMAEIGQRAHVAVSNLGKIKTAVQMLAIVALLSCDSYANAVLIYLGYILLYIAAILTIWSMCLYLKAAWAQLISS